MTMDEELKPIINTTSALKIKLDAVLSEFLSAAMLSNEVDQERLRLKAHTVLDLYLDHTVGAGTVLKRHGGVL